MIGGQRVSLDDPSEVLPTEAEAEQPQAQIETETPEQPEQSQEQGLRRLSRSHTTVLPRPEGLRRGAQAPPRPRGALPVIHYDLRSATAK